MKKVFGCLFQCHFFVEFLEVIVMIFVFVLPLFVSEENKLKKNFEENPERTILSDPY